MPNVLSSVVENNSNGEWSAVLDAMGQESYSFKGSFEEVVSVRNSIKKALKRPKEDKSEDLMKDKEEEQQVRGSVKGTTL